MSSKKLDRASRYPLSVEPRPPVDGSNAGGFSA